MGECSCTGLHGGNRLASNSLIEAVVYADAAAKHSLQVVDQYSYNENIPEWNDEGTRSPEEMVLITQSMKAVSYTHLPYCLYGEEYGTPSVRLRGASQIRLSRSCQSPLPT